MDDLAFLARYQDTTNRMEPEVFTEERYQYGVQVSIAISLKRIADTLAATAFAADIAQAILGTSIAKINILEESKND